MAYIGAIDFSNRFIFNKNIKIKTPQINTFAKRML